MNYYLNYISFLSCLISLFRKVRVGEYIAQLLMYVFCYINNFYFELYIKAAFCIEVYKKDKAAFESDGLLNLWKYCSSVPYCPILFFFLTCTLTFCTVLIQIDILVSWACISFVRLRATTLCGTKKHHH